MRCKNCTRLRWDGSNGRGFVCKLFGYNKNVKSYISVNSKGEEGCRYTEKILQKIEEQYYEAELEWIKKDIERKNKEKLNKLENLEDELGCRLEIIFKACRNGIIDSKGKEHEVVCDHYYLYVVEEDELIQKFDYVDYKKTWWLPSDKE